MMDNIIIKSVKLDGPPSTIEGLSTLCLCFRKEGHVDLCRYCDGSYGRQKTWIANTIIGGISYIYSDITHYIEFPIEDLWDEVNQRIAKESDAVSTLKEAEQ